MRKPWGRQLCVRRQTISHLTNVRLIFVRFEIEKTRALEIVRERCIRWAGAQKLKQNKWNYRCRPRDGKKFRSPRILSNHRKWHREFMFMLCIDVDIMYLSAKKSLKDEGSKGLRTSIGVVNSLWFTPLRHRMTSRAMAELICGDSRISHMAPPPDDHQAVDGATAWWLNSSLDLCLNFFATVAS